MRYRETRGLFVSCHRGALGDFILTWPTLIQARQRLGSSFFLHFGRPEYSRAAVNLGVVDGYKDIESPRFTELLEGNWDFDEEIVGGAFWISEPPENAPENVKILPPFPQPPPIHMAGRHLKSFFGAEPADVPLASTLNLHQSRPDEEKFVIIHPGSGGLSKTLPPSFHVEFGGILSERFQTAVSFVLGPVELERGLAEAFPRDRTIPTPTLDALTSVVRKASLYVGHDSGATHLAAFMGTPTAAIHVGTNPSEWGAIGKKVIHIEATQQTAASDVVNIINAWVRFPRRNARIGSSRCHVREAWKK